MKPLHWLCRKTVRLAELFVFFCGLPFVIWAGSKGMLFGVMRQSKDQETEAALIVDGAIRVLTMDQAHRVLQAAYARYVSEPVSAMVKRHAAAAVRSFESTPTDGETFH